jgi:hypothetical protein
MKRDKKKIKCPKCKCIKLTIREIGEWTTEHDWDGEKCTGHNNEPGSYFKVQAVCCYVIIHGL